MNEREWALTLGYHEYQNAQITVEADNAIEAIERAHEEADKGSWSRNDNVGNVYVLEMAHNGVAYPIPAERTELATALAQDDNGVGTTRIEVDRAGRTTVATPATFADGTPIELQVEHDPDTVNPMRVSDCGTTVRRNTLDGQTIQRVAAVHGVTLAHGWLTADVGAQGVLDAAWRVACAAIRIEATTLAETRPGKTPTKRARH